MIVSKLTKYYEESGKMFRKIVGEPMELSSTAIREMVKRGEDISSLVPPSVAEYIRLYGLYREG
jgi:nicotinic acid mononucleotide adenylyltransferase